MYAGNATADGDPCICTQIEVRKPNPVPVGLAAPGAPAATGPTIPALGPDARPGGDDWPSAPGEDGKTLGPLNLNPSNLIWPDRDPVPADLRGESMKFGYAFEVLATVTGDPDECTPNQLITSTRKLGISRNACDQLGGSYDADAELCTSSKSWKGTSLDLNADGTPLDVSNRQKCEANQGTWNNNKCTISGPYNGATYLPDMPSLPNTYLNRPNNKIIWYDAPNTFPVRRVSGMTIDQNILAYVRGSDNKYCYAKMTHNSKTVAGPDSETLSVIEKKTGQDSLPGVQ